MTPEQTGLLIALRPGDDRPIYLQIVDEIRRGVALELIRPDEPLPSVRQLAQELRINPNTVQQAYRELERDGTVYVLRGRGTFVADVSTSLEERRAVARRVARRALREAHRDGVTVEQLLEALDEVTREPSAEATPNDDREERS